MPVVTGYASVNNIPSGAWSNPTGGYRPDASVVSISRGTTKNSFDRIQYSGYGFNSLLPNEATINTVTLGSRHRVQTTSNLCFLENYASIGQVNGAVNSDALEPVALTLVTYTGYARPGGGTWTRGDLLDSGFNTTLIARNGNNATANVWEWDYLYVAVDYSMPSSGFFPKRKLLII